MLAMATFSAFLAAISQIMLKVAAEKYADKPFLKQYLNRLVIISYTIFTFLLAFNVYFFTLYDMKFGVLLNVLPTIFVLLISRIKLQEELTRAQVLGSVVVTLGVAIFSLG
jgi:drug/metabolite transporter (DMT)-like permease